ncbi:5'-nucleotidase C-terminal domain-containing protein [Peribacillus huizhouensis]|uniref:2',3'-cyclic-nucleotide 2'-phosphodiesterase (5'-nucleotidase family) n=1 Tax=Peribacillus huizhouensis TaxID=1501239 RepID=A0ABR6CNT0_9BACI|nr:5'-nucleotidase C-terminal domain-containing protein [Peribacillus huizhouensis]MBA9026702.1 2',3'-cyclic-nucleotide 2'-phosphodiesterase (5'-nucleotidase family) [Peribacillus huizhouensis]
MSYRTKSYRQFIATAAAATLITVALSPISNAATPEFTDVSKRYKEAIDYVVSKGAKGITNTSFGTQKFITRADAAILLSNVLELNTEHAPNSGFTDVPARAVQAVNALKAIGVTAGKTATSFDPNSPITRGELAIWIQKGFELTGKTNLNFTDVSERYQTAIETLISNKISEGTSKTSFGTTKLATRGDFSIFLQKSASVTGLDDEDYKLSLMHTNDTHSHVELVAKRATTINEVRVRKSEPLLIDAGDVMTGTLYFNEFQGKAELKFMNDIGYDVMTFGNHEFDQGSSNEGHQWLVDFIKEAKFPFVSANVDFSSDKLFDGLQEIGTYSDNPEDGKIYNGIIKEVNGEKVGIFGLTTAETVEISSPKDISFKNYIEEAKNSVKAFKELGINKIVAVTHLGYNDNIEFDNDLELAKQVDGIDVIIGGHSHTLLEKPTVVSEGKAEPTIIVQTGEYNNYVGTLDVKFDKNGKVIGQAGKLLSVKERAEDPTTAIALKPYADKIAEIQAESIGVTAVEPLNGARNSVRTSETNLGNLITDGMLSTAKTINPDTVIAMTNGGGIRESIDAGDITIGEVLTVMPFGNTLGIMNLKGSEIIDALEHSVSQAPEASGGFLHVSGMTFKYDSSKKAGNRVVEVNIKGEDGKLSPLQNDESYIVATNIFTAKGGDGFDTFAKAYADGRVSEPGFTDYQMFINYLKTFETVDPKVEGRIIDVSAAK